MKKEGGVLIFLSVEGRRGEGREPFRRLSEGGKGRNEQHRQLLMAWEGGALFVAFKR